jgi:hypothetical protein
LPIVSTSSLWIRSKSISSGLSSSCWDKYWIWNHSFQLENFKSSLLPTE